MADKETGGSDGADAKVGLKITFKLYAAVTTLGATAINAGINGGLAYVMYGAEGKAEAAGLFEWPDTIVGDMILTCFLTAFAQNLLSSQMGHADMVSTWPFFIKPASKPLASSYPRLGGWLLGQPRIFDGDALVSRKSKFVQVARRGLLLGVLSLFLVGVPVLVVFFFVSDKDESWDLELLTIFKAVLGGLLGTLLAPLIALSVGAVDDSTVSVAPAIGL